MINRVGQVWATLGCFYLIVGKAHVVHKGLVGWNWDMRSLYEDGFSELPVGREVWVSEEYLLSTFEQISG